MHVIAMYVLCFSDIRWLSRCVLVTGWSLLCLSLPSILGLCLFGGLSWGFIVWCASYDRIVSKHPAPV